MSSKFTKYLVSQDMYGHKIGVHYQGSDSFQTKLGSFCSFSTYMLMLANLIILYLAFDEGTKYDQKSQLTIVDRWFDDKHKFTDYDYSFQVFTFPALPANMGRFRVL